MGRWMGPTLEDLQRELNLTPEQRGAVGGYLQSAVEAVRKRFEEARASGFQDLDWAAIRAEAEKLHGETREKILGALTPEQRPRYLALTEERTKWLQSFFRRGETAAERVDRAMLALKIQDADETRAVKALVARVVQLQGDLSQLDRAAHDQIHALQKTEGLADETIRERLASQRKERRALEEALRKRQGELGEVLTAHQEMELVHQGILR
jgi:Spy/CpxP family protein refolding chaperone